MTQRHLLAQNQRRILGIQDPSSVYRGEIPAEFGTREISPPAEPPPPAQQFTGTLTATEVNELKPWLLAVTLGSTGNTDLIGGSLTCANVILAANGAIKVADGNPQIIFDNANNWLEITADRVGIRTATPSAELDINGSINIASAGSITQNSVNLIRQNVSTDAIYIGKLAGDEATGNDGVFIGENTGRYSTGNDNIYIGEDSGNSATNSGGNNVGIGRGTLSAQTSGANNVAIGVAALNTVTAGHSNMAMGQGALQLTTGNSNVAMGTYALQLNTTGTENVGVGGYALIYHTTGVRNTAIGVRAGQGVNAQSIASNDGVYIGNLAGSLITTGDENIAVGRSAMDNLSSGRGNIALGFMAGDVLTTGSKNIYIGYDIDARAVDESNKLNIGNLIFGDGVDAIGTGISSGNVGIRTATFGADMAGGMAIALGTDPTGEVADQFAFWGKDIVAGNTGPAFRTENGTVIQLDQSLLTTDTGIVFGALAQIGTATNKLTVSASGDLAFAGTARIGWTKITANSVAIRNEHGTSGDGVSDLDTAHDINFYTLTEEGGETPGMDMEVVFTGVTAFNWVQVLCRYEKGAATHGITIMLEATPFDDATWHRYHFCIDQGADLSNEDHSFFVPDDAAYINSGVVKVRFVHEMLGTGAHDLVINGCTLYQ